MFVCKRVGVFACLVKRSSYKARVCSQIDSTGRCVFVSNQFDTIGRGVCVSVYIMSHRVYFVGRLGGHVRTSVTSKKLFYSKLVVNYWN